MLAHRTRLVPVVAIVALLSLAGCGSDSVSSDEAKESVDHAVAAVELAADEVGGTAFELDEEGRQGWDVSVVDGEQVTEVRVDREATEVTKTTPDGRIDADDQQLVAAATVSLADALATAADETVGRVSSAELDGTAGSSPTWVIEFDNGDQDTTVSVDATTGEVGAVTVDKD